MIIHGVISILLIVSVLLQFGKGAEAGLLSGGGGESVMSGGQKGNILTKITTILSVIFMANSILLAKIQSQKSSDSLLDDQAPIARPLNNDKAEKGKTPKQDTETKNQTKK
tara:strand:+ start:440 stop:772 length:333 start_codon:yes stop_codon:yes gene_type:complete